MFLDQSFSAAGELRQIIDIRLPFEMCVCRKWDR